MEKIHRLTFLVTTKSAYLLEFMHTPPSLRWQVYQRINSESVYFWNQIGQSLQMFPMGVKELICSSCQLSVNMIIFSWYFIPNIDLQYRLTIRNLESTRKSADIFTLQDLGTKVILQSSGKFYIQGPHEASYPKGHKSLSAATENK